MEQVGGLLPHEGPPYLGIAAFCERAIQDQEGLFTLVRVYDELTLTVPEGIAGPSSEVPIPLNLSFFVALKAVDQVPWQPLSLYLIGPNGERQTEQRLDENPITGKANLNIDGSVQIHLTSEGLYQVEVVIDGRLLSRIPLLVQIRRVPLSEVTVGLRGVE